MSVIYPSELDLPYGLNYDNDITKAIISSGTGIYFSDDSLASVINYVDNSAATAADITSNELASVDGYHIGVDISGLSAEQQTSVQANPYQLFETAATKREQYCIKLTLPTHSISLPFIGAFSGVITLDDDTEQAISGSGTYVVDGTVPINIKAILATDTVNSYLWVFDRWINQTSIADEYNGIVATLNGFPEYAGYVFDENGNVIGYQFNGVDVSAVTSRFYPVLTDGSVAVEFTYDSSVISRYLGSDNNNYYIRTRTSGDIEVRSAGSGSSSTTVNAGLVDGNRYKLRVRFTATGYTIYLSEVTVTEGEITYSPENEVGSNIYPIGNGMYFDRFARRRTHQWYKCLIHSVEYYEGSTLAHRYDLTVGDSDSFPDTVGDDNAVIVNQPTSGFVPVLETQVFSVGTGKDYETFANFTGAEGGDKGAHYIAEIHSLLPERFTGGSYQDKFSNLTVRAAEGQEFTGDINQGAGFDGIGTTNRPVMDMLLSSADNLNINVEGLRFLSGYENNWAGDLGSNNSGSGTLNLTAKRCGFKAASKWVTANSFYLVSLASDRSTYKLKDCVLVDYPRIAASAAEFIGNDLLWIANGQTSNIMSGSGSSITNLAYDNASVALNPASNSLNNAIDINGVNALINEVGGDYRINGTGQVVLKGAGWNGTDIASSFYAVDDGGDTGGITHELILKPSIQMATGGVVTADFSLALASVYNVQHHQALSLGVSIDAFLTGTVAEQRQQSAAMQALLGSSLSSVVAKQEQVASIVDAIQLLNVTSKGAVQETQSLVNVLSIGGQLSSVSGLQMQHALQNTTSKIAEFISSASEQVTLSGDANVVANKLLSTTSTKQESFSVNGNVITGSALVVQSAEQLQLASLGDATTIFETLSSLAAQYAHAKMATTLSVQRYESIAAYQAQLSKGAFIYTAAMPDIDLESVVIVSLTPSIKIENLTPRFIIE